MLFFALHAVSSSFVCLCHSLPPLHACNPVGDAPRMGQALLSMTIPLEMVIWANPRLFIKEFFQLFRKRERCFSGLIAIQIGAGNIQVWESSQNRLKALAMVANL